MDKQPQVLVDELLAGLDRVLGTSYSAVLFGSAARGDYIATLSDINILVVLDEASPETLRRLERPLGDWHSAGQLAPLLITRAEWGRATDVFPVELVDLQDTHRVLRGSDPVAGLTVNAAHLRIALETDLRGKLLRLRRGYVALRLDPVAMTRVMAHTVPQLLLLFRALLRLLDRPIPREHETLVGQAAAIVGFDPETVLVIDRRRREREWLASSAEYEGYMRAVEAAARFVDHLHVGAHA
jgi:hypothetical protein